MLKVIAEPSPEEFRQTSQIEWGDGILSMIWVEFRQSATGKWYFVDDKISVRSLICIALLSINAMTLT